jgi:chloramphenicol O-acetyltransferase type A
LAFAVNNKKVNMEEINIDDWERKEHFNFFLRSDLPFYNVNFYVDITGLRDYTKTYRLSINNTLIFLVTKTLNNIDNFRY